MGHSRESRDRWNEEKRRRRALKKLGEPTFATFNSDGSRPIEELLSDRRKEFDRQTSRGLGNPHHLSIPVDGPFGVLFFGDPHLDDPGTNIYALEADLDLVRSTEGLYAVGVGDMTNNWCAKLAHLYAKQTTTAREAWELVEWFVERLGNKLLFLCGGNHDAWSGEGDPLVWIARQAGTQYEMDELRVSLDASNGESFVGTVRHNWKGRSMWNVAHALFRAAKQGRRDEFLIGGHTHSTQTGVFRDPATGKIIHVMQLGSYKEIDDYKVHNDLEESNITPSGLFIFDPDAAKPEARIQPYICSQRGARDLVLRREK